MWINKTNVTNGELYSLRGCGGTFFSLLPPRSICRAARPSSPRNQIYCSFPPPPLFFPPVTFNAVSFCRISPSQNEKKEEPYRPAWYFLRRAEISTCKSQPDRLSNAKPSPFANRRLRNTSEHDFGGFRRGFLAYRGMVQNTVRSLWILESYWGYRYNGNF